MTLAVDSEQAIKYRMAQRATWTLAAAQALYSAATVIIIATGGLVGTMIAPSPAWATAPITTFVIGTALSTIPAALLMRRFGRRPGFMLGAACGTVSAVLAIYAMYERNFALFCFATLLQGTYQAFAQQFRFAAVDLAEGEYRAKAIAYVMAGGLAGGIFGPLVIMHAKDLLAPVQFAGSYAVSALMTAAAIAVLATLHIPHVRHESVVGDERPLSEIFTQPRLIVAMICGMVSYGVMNLVMTASPIAMVACGFSIDDAAWAVQWHVVAMYVPSFFVGHLINRFGVEKVVAAGLVLLLGAGIAGLAGLSFANFSIGLILLGIGWNFGFTGGTAMVTTCYRPAEKNKVQGINDFAVFAAVACASLASGGLLASLGWGSVNVALFPMVGLCVIALIYLALARPPHLDES